MGGHGSHRVHGQTSVLHLVRFGSRLNRARGSEFRVKIFRSLSGSKGAQNRYALSRRHSRANPKVSDKTQEYFLRYAARDFGLIYPWWPDVDN